MMPPLCSRCGRQMDGPGHRCPELHMTLLPNGLVHVRTESGLWGLWDPQADDWRYDAPTVYYQDADRVREWLEATAESSR